MNADPLPFDDTVANTPFDTAVEGLMAALLLFSPLAFGATRAWSQEVWFALVGALGLSLGLKLVLCRGAPVVRTWAYLPVAAFLLLVVVQCVPLPTAWAAAVSPATVATKHELLSDLPAGNAAATTLTFYARATVRQALLTASVATVFVVVLHVYRTPVRTRRLLMTMAGAGLVVAVVAAVQDAVGATTIYGLVPIGHKNAGTFQNYSHFSQFMNLSVGAALGLLLMTITEWTAADPDLAAVTDELRRPRNAYVWGLLALCVAGPVLVLLSMSRMGMISALLAGGATAALVGWRTRAGGRGGAGRAGHTTLVVGLGVAAFALLLVVGFDVVYDRLATVQAKHTDGGRWQILKDLLPLFRQYPVFGTGLGTYEFVFPMFDRLRIPQINTHAENEYAQLMAETGGLGVLMAAGFLAVVFRGFGRAVWRPREPVQFAAFGLGFGLIAVLIHSASDFGQHVPAVATLTAVTAALLVNLGAGTRRTRPPKSPSSKSAATSATPLRPASRPGWRLARTAALGGFVVAAGGAMVWAENARRGEAAWFRATAAADDLAANGWQANDDDDFRRLLAPAAAAAAAVPDDVTYRYWLNVYRWQAVGSEVDPATGQLRLSEEAVAFARQIVDEFDAARVLCPTFGPPLCMAGQIRSSVLDDRRGDAQVRTAYRLTPFDSTVCRLAGDLALRQYQWNDSIAAYRQFIAVGGSPRYVIDAYLNYHAPEWAYAVTGGQRDTLTYLAAKLADRPADATVAERCRAEADRLLVAETDRPAATGDALAERAAYEAARGRPADAVAWYQKAVDLDYARVDWRMAMAQALAGDGHYDRAVRQLQICLRVRPKWDAAERLLAAYSVRVDSAAGATSVVQ